jgi:hypothetical protein
MPDCLASTGIDSFVPLIAGLVVLAIGTMLYFMARGRSRRAGGALLLALILVAGGGALAIAPASQAQAAACDTTPPPPVVVPALDYSISADIEEPNPVSGSTDMIAFSLTNTVIDQAGTPPIVVRIPRLPQITNVVPTPVAGWTLDDVSDPANYVFTFSDPLPAAGTTTIALFVFDVIANTSTDLVIPVTIDTGSGGDTVVGNNQATVALTISPPVP